MLLPKELIGSWCPIEAGSDKYFKTKDCKTDNPINVRDTGYDDSVDVDCKFVSIRKTTKMLAETKAICHDHGSGKKTMQNVDWFFSDMKTLRIVKLKISP